MEFICAAELNSQETLVEVPEIWSVMILSAENKYATKKNISIYSI